ncbi:aspartyl/asparaginyl beta-hydroxylase domain-containing protein [Zooshikella sp. RANM57]|uniref:aspartyl/asparaginyl beta-hydroxylase domain-containing protein n=1 Tax=Zooshikella sp. RANM57 TaxID=3425863 RepID=UPI003D6DFBA4
MLSSLGLTTEQLSQVEQLFTLSTQRFGQSSLDRLKQALFSQDLSPPQDNRWQQPKIFFPFLKSKPWYESKEIDGVQTLISMANAIQGELEDALMLKKNYECSDKTGYNGQWNIFYLSRSPLLVDERIKFNQQSCPSTLEGLKRLPRFAGTAWFSALNPHSSIPAHFGDTNLKLNLHLGLIVPDDCALRVADESKAFLHHDCLIFADSFEHEAWNNSDTTRITLFADIWHPDLTDAEVFVLSQLQGMYDVAIQQQRTQDIGGKHFLDNEKWWVL